MHDEAVLCVDARDGAVVCLLYDGARLLEGRAAARGYILAGALVEIGRAARSIR